MGGRGWRFALKKSGCPKIKADKMKSEFQIAAGNFIVGHRLSQGPRCLAANKYSKHHEDAGRLSGKAGVKGRLAGRRGRWWLTAP